MTDPASGSAPSQFSAPSADVPPPPPNAAFPIAPPVATQSPSPSPDIPSSPAAPGADSAAAIEALISAFEAQLSEQFNTFLNAAHSKVADIVSAFESYLAKGQNEIDLIVSELQKGGVTGRLHALEMAVASSAAAVLMPAGHDGHGLLAEWFASIKDRFHKAVSAAVADTAASAEPPPAAPEPVPVSPAAAQIVALGIPQFQPPPRL